MQSQSVGRDRVDTHASQAAVASPLPEREHSFPGPWMTSGALAGAAMGTSAYLTVAIPSCHSLLQLAQGGLFMVLCAFVGLVLGFMGGLVLALAEGYCAPGNPTLAAAALVGGVLGALLFALAGLPQIGFALGAAAGFSAALWTKAPVTLPLEGHLPLRGRWLRIGVTGLLLALTPAVSIGVAWAWRWPPR